MYKLNYYKILKPFLLFFLNFYLISGFTPDLLAEDIIKSPNDKRAYRYLKLPNGLKVTLVHDDEISESTAAMTVGVGAFADPKEFQGLAHFLEHMLFLGSKKYPEPDEYWNYITKKGGSANAFTSSQRTTYFFTINNDVFEGALDRFAQFFIAPLFDEAFVEREVNAVNAEHSRNINNDSRRIYQVKKHIANPLHPFGNFSTGNKETLSKEGLREALIHFYLQHYSANKMSLSIVSKNSLDESQTMVESYFNEIKNTGAKIKKWHHYIYDQKKVPALLKVRPLKNTQSLRISFAMPSYQKEYAAKSFHFISKVLGSEEKGSLLSFFKKKNWVTSLSAGGGSLHDTFAEFSLSVSLTDLGEKNVDQIIDHIFDYIHLFKKKGVEKWRFEENRRLSEIAFRYKEKSRASGVAINLSQNMQEYPVEDLLYAPYRYGSFNKKQIFEIFDYLNPNNLVVLLISQNIKTNQKERYYATEYAYEKIDKQKIELWQKTLKDGKNNKALSLPVKNRFIPEKIDIINYSDSSVDQLPEKLYENKKIAFWFLHDDRFNLPKSSLSFRMLVPRAYQSPKEAAMSKLLARIWNESLNEALYPSYEAGFSYSFSATAKGFSGSVFGYADKLALLLDMLTVTLKKVDVSDARFETMKKELLKSWNNRKLNSSLSLAGYDFFILGHLNIWYQDDYIEIIPKITLSDLKRFAKGVFDQMKIQAFFHGNATKEQAKNLFDILDSFKDFQPLFDSQIPSARYLLFDDQKENVRQLKSEQDENAAVLVSYQLAKRGIKELLQCRILSQLLQKPFFHQLRTIEQLGYVVNASMSNRNFLCHGVFVIQSPVKDPIELEKRIGLFIEDYAEKLKQITDHDIETLKNSIEKSYKQPVQTSGELRGKYWAAILDNDDQFLLNEPYLDALKTISKEDIISLYHQLFLEEKPRKFTIHVFGRDQEIEPVAGAIEDINIFKKTSTYLGHKDTKQLLEDD